MNRRTVIFQWAQLLVLSAVHFTVDLFGNSLPSILPAIRTEFALKLSAGIVLTTALTIAANGIQLVSGHLRPHKTRPLFLHLGMWLAVTDLPFTTPSNHLLQFAP